MNRILLIAILPLIFFSSCSMEKRVYRKGWYIDPSRKTEHTFSDYEPNAQIQPQVNDAEMNTEIPAPDSTKTIKENTGISKAEEAGNDTCIKKEQVKNTAVHEPLPRMSHQEAIKRMKEKGCTPNSLAETAYIMAFVAIPLIILTGLGFPLAIVAFILSFLAEKRVIESGNCVEENLAIVRKARITSLIIMLATALIIFIVVSLILGIMSLGFAF